MGREEISVYKACIIWVSSQASRRRRTILGPRSSAFPLAFPIELALVTPIIRRAVTTTNRRPRRCRRHRLLPKAPTGVWCSHLNRTRTSARSWGSTRRSSRFRSRAQSERREGSRGLYATRTHCHLRDDVGRVVRVELVSGCRGADCNGTVYLRCH